jgi:hypothetical protein
MDTKFLLLIISTFLLFSSIYSGSCPQTYSCLNDTANSTVCSTETQQPDGTFVYKLKGCPKDNFCPWSSATPTTNATCQQNPNTTSKKYPGQSCSGNDDCFSGNCTASKCVGVAAEGACTAHSQCSVGYSCFNFTGGNGTCRIQGGNSAPCVEDFDCTNTHGCLNSVCTGYFSVGANQPVVFLQGYLSFCASGLADATTKKCVNKTNVGTAPYTCDSNSPCNYTENYSNTTISDPESCKCGMTKNGTQYCVLGNGMKDYQSYVSAFQAYLKSTVNNSCHTLERSDCPWVIQHDSQNYLTFRSLRDGAKNYHEVVGADTCVLQAAFPFYKNTPPVPPVTRTCPAYTCPKSLDNTNDCLEGSYDQSKNNANVKVKKCGTGKYCDMSAFSPLSFTDKFNATCNDTKVTPLRTRFPGEACDDNNKCVQGESQGECDATKKVCPGVAESQLCNSHLNCTKGLYCKKDNDTVVNGTCTKQVAKGGNCTEDLMCPNTQGCMSGKCTDYYSVALKTAFDNKTMITPYNMALCKSGMIVNFKCYNPRAAAKNMTVDKNDVATLDSLDKQCTYTDSEGADYSESPTCSRDSKGKILCNRVYDESKSDWTNYFNALRKRTDNTCHTLNRFNCYDDKSKTDMYNSVVKTTRAAELLYADACVQQFFASSSLLKMSLIALASLLIHFL